MAVANWRGMASGTRYPLSRAHRAALGGGVPAWVRDRVPHELIGELLANLEGVVGRVAYRLISLGAPVGR
jgi:hypothetical protein